MPSSIAASFRRYLKKVFSPDCCVAPSSQILDILEYACGLTLGRALNSNENPNFEMGFKKASQKKFIGAARQRRTSLRAGRSIPIIEIPMFSSGLSLKFALS